MRYGERKLVALVSLFLIASLPVVRGDEKPPESQESSAGSGEVETSAWHEPGYWKTLDGKPVDQSWEFAEGEIRLVRPRGGRNSLLSPPLPPHFELAWRWKIDEKTNSGIKYRVRRLRSQWLGLEYQIRDEPLTPGAAAQQGATAAIYDLRAPAADKPLRAAGQWNESRVVARGKRIEHYLNGSLAVSVDLSTPAWEAMLAKSKFSGLEDFGQPRKGDRVLLTDHGGRITYANFRFTPLDAPAESSSGSSVNAGRGPFLGNAIRNGWADQDSIVLWTRTTARPEMVRDGPGFVDPSSDEVKELSSSDDAERQVGIQLPDGMTLDEIEGACPGAPGEVQLTYFPAERSSRKTVRTWQETDAEKAFTHQWHLDRLQPGTRYVAVVEARPVGGDEPTAVVRGEFETAPAANQATPLRFCMTTCHSYHRRDDGPQGHKIYPSMKKLDPNFVIHAGDIEYYDKPNPFAWTISLMRFKWNRIFALPQNRDFYQHTTSYFLKDDHDTLKNDCWAGTRYGSVTFEEGVELFNEEQFPSHVPRYKTVRWGRDLQIWLLEGRDFRSPNTMPDGPQKTILGDEQKAWLVETVRASDAIFKLVVSPTPIVGPDRTNKHDNHANEDFAYEGKQLREFLGKHPGVIVLCGDRHWQYASHSPEEDLWEFGCGPGSEEHQLGWKEGDVRPEHEFLRVAGGFLSGDITYEGVKPILTLRHRTVEGKQVSEFRFPTE